MFVSSIEFIGYITILLSSLVIHENVHARVAYYLGDSTAKDMGRFSFNPLTTHCEFQDLITNTDKRLSLEA
jgi:Zn-dependent protease